MYKTTVETSQMFLFFDLLDLKISILTPTIRDRRVVENAHPPRLESYVSKL